jgi:hypothetical protein
MAKKRDTPETIIRKLREAEVLQGQGQTIAQVVKQLGIAEQTCYRWRKEYGGLRVDQAKRLKALEAENARLKRAVADLTVDKQILKKVVEGMYGPPRDCKNPSLGVARQVCINVSGLLVGASGPGHDGDPHAVGSIGWFGLCGPLSADRTD